MVAASRTLERVVISTAKSLFSDERLWDAVPAGARTVARRVQSFALLSRTLCLATSMEEMHSEYPFRLFLLLLDPSLSQQVKAEKCQMDPWSLAFVEHHEARDGLGSSNALHDLLTSVIMGRWDAAPLESRHASIRRSIVSLSCQTHLASFVDLSAREVLRRYRKVVQRASNPRRSKTIRRHSRKATFRRGVRASTNSEKARGRRSMASTHRNLSRRTQQRLQAFGSTVS